MHLKCEQLKNVYVNMHMQMLSFADNSSGDATRLIELYSVSSELDDLSVFMPGSFMQRSLLSNVHKFEVTCKGGEFTSSHSYSITIPENAVKQGESVTIKTGIMTYGPCGPFACPEDATIVSPIVWFMSEPEVHFRKPVVLKIQHCSTSCNNIGVLKGRHVSPQAQESFQMEKIDINLVQDTEEDDYVCLSIDHFCVYCLSIYTQEYVEKMQFCIVPIEGYKAQENEVIFCITYYLDTCISVSVHFLSLHKCVNHYLYL